MIRKNNLPSTTEGMRRQYSDAVDCGSAAYCIYPRAWSFVNFGSLQ